MQEWIAPSAGQPRSFHVCRKAESKPICAVQLSPISSPPAELGGGHARGAAAQQHRAAQDGLHLGYRCVHHGALALPQLHLAEEHSCKAPGGEAFQPGLNEGYVGRLEI